MNKTLNIKSYCMCLLLTAAASFAALAPFTNALASPVAGATAPTAVKKHSVPKYTVLELKSLSSTYISGTVRHLNNSYTPGQPMSNIAAGNSFGSLVGGVATTQPAAYNSDGSVVSIASGGFALGINAKGNIVGIYGDASFTGQKPFIRTSAGITPLPATLPKTEAIAINDNDVIVGAAKSGLQYMALYWVNNVMTVLNPTAYTSALRDINNANTMVGYIQQTSSGPYSAFWQTIGEASPHILPIPAGYAPVCEASAINDNGVIVGFCPKNSAYQPIQWVNNQAIELPVLPNEGTGGGVVNDVNIRGQAVGRSHWYRAVLWLEGEVHDLNTLVGDYPYFLTNAVAINDQGVIAAHALKTSPSATVAVLLIPKKP